MNFRNSFKKFTTELSWSLRVCKPTQLNGLIGQNFPLAAASCEKDGLTSKKKSLVLGVNVKHNFDLLKIENKLESSLEKNFFKLPKTDLMIPKQIIDPQKIINLNIELPFKNDNKEIDLPCNTERELIEPIGNVIKKQAAILIRIRRKKMRKHRYKKFIKKMRAEFMKRRKARKLEKEKVFQKSLKAILDESEAFDARQEMKRTLAYVRYELPITRVKGIRAPQSVVREHLQNLKEQKLIHERVQECLKKLK